MTYSTRYRRNKVYRKNPQQSATGVDSIEQKDSLYLAYPKGGQCWVWIRLNEEGEPCVRFYWKFPCPYTKMKMDVKGEYTTVYAKVHPYLTIGNGSLLKCVLTRQNKVPVCTISEVIWWKGNYVFHEPFIPMLGRVYEMIGRLDMPILTKLYHPKQIKCIQLCLPLMISKQWRQLENAEQKQQILEYIDSISYPVYHVLEYGMTQNVKSGKRYSFEEFRKRFVPETPLTAIFTMRAMEEHDSYELVNETYKSVYVVSTIQESRRIHRWMGNVYGINCLDDIEESDAEDLPIHEVQVECIRKGDSWVPVKVV